MPATLLYAGLLGLLAVILANQVLHARVQRHKVPEWKAEATLRAQGNFVEQAPLALVLLYVLEVSGVPTTAIHVMGAGLCICRCLHAWGMSRRPVTGVSYARLIGAQGTFLLVAIMGALAVLMALTHILSR